MVRTREMVLCLSHHRWDFTFQRPQHLMSRCARDHDVVFVEEPIFDALHRPELVTTETEAGVTVAVPHLPPSTPAMAAEQLQRVMVDRLLQQLDYPKPVLWYYSPMALAFTHHVRARAVVYDCMDELSQRHGAPTKLPERESLLMRHADVVFTAGQALFDHKRATSLHANIHPFPSSVDVEHFARAREPVAEPGDQAAIPHPRIGCYGVIDERIDLALLAELAVVRPDLHFVMLGPIVGIDEATVPRAPNLHWLGARRYDHVPAYLAGWDVALMLFARTDATRYLAPTRPPEYLAAGRPIVSTSIPDVVVPYGRSGLTWLGDSAPELSLAIDRALASDREDRNRRGDSFLAEMTWDRTWRGMWNHVEQSIQGAESRSLESETLAIPKTSFTTQPAIALAPRGSE